MVIIQFHKINFFPVGVSSVPIAEKIKKKTQKDTGGHKVASSISRESGIPDWAIGVTGHTLVDEADVRRWHKVSVEKVLVVSVYLKVLVLC